MHHLRLPAALLVAALAAGAPALAKTEAAAEPTAPTRSTADHGKFKSLQKAFASGPEVTAACLECHTEAAKQVHTSKHWTWEYDNPRTGQKLGKRNVLNNFCTALPSNYSFCAACHVGYGWKDAKFDFGREEAVDCIVCHDTTGTYKKIPGLAGHPTYKTMEWPPKSGKFIEPPDLKKIAQNVGPTSRQTCGACHFFGGGGNAVKHGDLDSSLANPPRFLDVHMDAKGLNFQCSTCHVSDKHEVGGSRYMTTASVKEGPGIRGKKSEGGETATTCQNCHGLAPHASNDKLNDHTRKLACQTCHVPAYARGPLHTKMSWDWSTAGRKDESGKPLKLADSTGREAYDAKKGDFTWDRYVIPEYVWFNGTIRYTLFGDTVDGSQLVKINEFQGSPDDPESRIWPVKVHRGKQPFDRGLKTLAVAHTAGKGDEAFWTGYDWDKALTVGMKEMGVEYSGQLGFVETEMTWPITHMVPPKEDALACAQCHKKGGRLEGLKGVYIPGRDGSRALDALGSGFALFALLGVLVHGGIRIVAARKRKD